MLHISVPSMPSMIYWKRGMDEPSRDISVSSVPSVVKNLRALRGKKNSVSSVPSVVKKPPRPTW